MVKKNYELDKDIMIFLEKNNYYEKPLREIIKNMMKHCTYINGESLNRHQFGEKPILLNNIPKKNNINFENELFESLDLNYDKSIIELLWGDIQLGKRIQACIIMWISVYILKRPVIYIFRNLKIDQNQLADDIRNCNNADDFNMKYIKSYFDKFLDEKEEEDDWKNFKLPELKDLGKNSEENEHLKKMDHENSINPNDIFCCLMNHKQLDKIDTKLTDYICNNHKLMNVTLIVDESDLYAPTASNNEINKNDLKDSTKCEQLLAKIYKKVRYVLHVTGTAHSLLYNVTTKLSDNASIQIKISKVHKMKRSDNYYGLFNSNIKFITDSVNEWWTDIDSRTNKKKSYELEEDYIQNISSIIEKILERPQNNYHSLLISEEKTRQGHTDLADLILKDYSSLFVVIFNGKILRLYLPDKYEKTFLNYSKKEKRLYKSQGINNSAIKYNFNYNFFDINSKKFNLKQVYKLIAMFLKEEELDYKTVITITGKYGERGYSFTSDNYERYSFHLTDQYFPCHVKNKNCTDISQRLRLQGKYSDNPELTLWTSIELKKIILEFFVPFMKEIERKIMDKNNWFEIKELIESIIVEQQNINFEYIKYIDAKKKLKSINLVKHYEKKYNGVRLIKILNMSNDDIKKWCRDNNLPKYNCINRIKDDLNKKDFIEKYGEFDINKPVVHSININLDDSYDILIEKIQQKFGKELKIKYINAPTQKWFKKRKEEYDNKNLKWTDRIFREKFKVRNIDLYKKNFHSNLNTQNHNYIWNFAYKNNKLYLILRYTFENKTKLPKICTDISSNKIIFHELNNIIKYSKLKSKYSIENLPEKYYWKTPDGWLFYHDNQKTQFYSINITEPKQTNNNSVVKFINSKIVLADKKNLRFGINEIYNKYKEWCRINNLDIELKIDFTNIFKYLGFNQEKSKGVDINGNKGKRGYNITFK